LAGRALDHYHDLGRTLDEMGVITQADWAALASAARVYGRLRDGYDKLAELPDENLDEWSKISGRLDNLEQQYRGWMGKLGLSPSDRSRVSVVKPPEADGKFANLELVK
jgi:hypothetical protein